VDAPRSGGGGNTVIVMEHNLDVIKTADWMMDLGPEGGEAGGYTGQFLRKVLADQTR